MKARWIATALVAVLLGACGGGGGGNPSPPPVSAPSPVVNTAPVSNAGQAQQASTGATVVFDGTASSDADGDSLAYSWRIASAPVGSSAVLSSPSSSMPLLVPDVDGNYSVGLVVGDGKASSAESFVTLTVTPTRAITVNAVEPVAGAVILGLTGSPAAVTWYVDGHLLGTGNEISGAISWNTTGVSNDSHLVVAQIQTSPGTFQEVRRTIAVLNSSVVLHASVSGTSGTIQLDAFASSDFGITSVSVTLDGTSLGSLSARNACYRVCVVYDVYRFFLDAQAIGSGTHTAVITAVDGSGASKTMTITVPVSNGPLLALTSPQPDTFVSGTLQLAGTVSTDKAGTVTIAVTASLGDQVFFSGSGPSFSASYSLAGLPGGKYEVTVRATDSDGAGTTVKRNIVVATSTPAYSPLFTIPGGGTLVAADGSKVLYSTGHGGMQLRDIGSGADVALSGASTVQYASGWQLSGSTVYAFGKDSDCVLYCIYQWIGDGTRANLTNSNPYSVASNIGGGFAYDLYPIAKDRYVLWVDGQATDTVTGSGRYTLYDTVAGTYTRIASPVGAQMVGNSEYDFAVVGGVVHFYFWAQTGGGSQPTYDIYHWQSDTEVTTQLTAGGSINISPQTDGSRAIWRQSTVGVTTIDFHLLSQPVPPGPTTQVSASAIHAKLADGVLVWSETNGSGFVLKADAAGTTSTLSILNSGGGAATRGGRVVYPELAKLFTWDVASRTSTLRLEVMPSDIVLASDALWFRIGTAIYRVPL